MVFNAVDDIQLIQNIIVIVIVIGGSDGITDVDEIGGGLGRMI